MLGHDEYAFTTCLSILQSVPDPKSSHLVHLFILLFNLRPDGRVGTLVTPNYLYNAFDKLCDSLSVPRFERTRLGYKSIACPLGQNGVNVVQVGRERFYVLNKNHTLELL